MWQLVPFTDVRTNEDGAQRWKMEENDVKVESFCFNAIVFVSREMPTEK